MKKMFFITSLLVLGFGCNQNQPMDITTQRESIQAPLGSTQLRISTEVVENVIVASSTTGKLAVKRTFTLDEIETSGGGLKNWFRDLARANVAGKKTLVRVPVNHVFGFGCVAPLKYCVSTETGGCFGPFVDLKGDFEIIKKATTQCDTVCNAADGARCTQEFRNNQCSTLWEVEGYVVAANRLPEASDDGTPGTCADGQLTYDFQVTKVVQKLADGQADNFRFYEFK